MSEELITLSADDGKKLRIRRWQPDAKPRAIIQIAHGMAEHGGRYQRFAAALTAAGYVVYAGDHRGHGLNIETPQDQGFFATQNGWAQTQADLWLINRRAVSDYPDLPVFLFGHSMGSFMAQQFMAEHGTALNGVILCASNGKPNMLATIGLWIARFEKLRLSPHGYSQLLNTLSFGEFNKAFKPARTDFDWLSRDPVEVDKYIADPLCGFICTTSLWCDLIEALPSLTSPAMIAKIPKALPILVIAGTKDPVSAGTKGLASLLAAYETAGLKKIQHTYYDGARHELLNETNRAAITHDILAWLEKAQSSPA